MQHLPPPNWFSAFPVLLNDEQRAWTEDLRVRRGSSLKVFRGVDLHVTLAFYGPLKPAQIGKVLLATSLVSWEPLEATFESILFLPSQRRCSAISLSFDLGKKLLINTMAEAGPRLMDSIGKDPDTRDPLPHMTIARPRKWRGAIPDQEANWLKALELPGGQVIIEKPVVFTRSHDRKKSLFRKVVAN